MRKLVLTALSSLIMVSMVLAGCSTPTPETIVQTVEVEKPVVQTQIVEATAAPSTEAYERSETLYTSGTQWGPPSSWNPFNTGNYATGT
ncbi:MAG: hypothetical protein GYA17_22765, partial [Chloroflexi bacterium]|nr:hypothetical protein [Chloroflexota bacterium]